MIIQKKTRGKKVKREGLKGVKVREKKKRRGNRKFS